MKSPAELSRRGPGFWVTAAVGAAGIAFGLHGLLTHAVDTRPTNWAKFFFGGVILHDAVFAPVVLAGGFIVGKVVPPPIRRWVQAAVFIIGCLALFAWPEVRDYARILNNPTSLPYNYTANLGAVVLAVVVAVAVAAAGGRVLRRRPPRTPLRGAREWRDARRGRRSRAPRSPTSR